MGIGLHTSWLVVLVPCSRGLPTGHLGTGTLGLELLWPLPALIHMVCMSLLSTGPVCPPLRVAMVLDGPHRSEKIGIPHCVFPEQRWGKMCSVSWGATQLGGSKPPCAAATGSVLQVQCMQDTYPIRRLGQWKGKTRGACVCVMCCLQAQLHSISGCQ